MAAQAAALKRVSAARNRVEDAVSSMGRGEMGAETGLLRADQELGEAEQALEEAGHLAEGEAPEADDDVVEPVPHDPLYGAEAGRRLPWKRIALVAAGLFVAVMVVITIFELTTGRAVSSFTGGSDKNTGSTVPGVQQPREETRDERSPDDEPSESPDVAPTDETEPTEGPTAEPTVDPSTPPTEPTEPTEPTVSPTATPTVEPSVAPDGSTG
jgi:hypothetical protein